MVVYEYAVKRVLFLSEKQGICEEEFISIYRIYVKKWKEGFR